MSFDPPSLPPKDPIPPAPHEPARNQFGLRDMFLLMTVVCIIVAAASLAGLNRPEHLTGALAIVLFCALVIGIIEGFRILTKPRPLNSPSRLGPIAVGGEKQIAENELPQALPPTAIRNNTASDSYADGANSESNSSRHH
jgi:hypothetical protein